LSKVDSILFVTYHFPPEVGGIQTRIVGYLSELSRRGIRSTVLFVGPSAKMVRTHEGMDPALILPHGTVELVKCESGIKGLFPAAAKALLLISTGRAGVVHVFTGGATFLGVFALLVGRLLGHPSSMSVFGREDISKPTWLGGVLFMFAGTLATSISTNSSSTKELLPIQFRRKTRILLGGSWVPLQQENRWPDGKTVLFVGRLVKRKGVDDLLNAFAIVRFAIPEASLTIVGNGPEREALARLVTDLGLADSVHFRGTLLGRSLSLQYEECTVCVLPSKEVADDTATEGFGLALVEAAVHGKPLVGTDHGGISEIIKDGFNGYIIPQGDPKRLSTVLERLLEDKELAQKMGANSLSIARSKFTLESATDRLLESYAN
jgi:glycosyltransferase involved in cell wall biosynthesis